MRPSLRQLEYAVALARAGTFRQAAADCHITQPALSVQIQHLERDMGAQLFERSRRGVLLTPAGEEFVARAREVLSRIDDLVITVGAHANLLTGVIRMGVIPTVAPYYLPRVAPRLRRHYPDLRLRLREGKTADLVELATRGELDVLLLALEADLGTLDTAPIARDPFVVAAPRDHAFARRKQLRQRDLENAEILLLEDGHCLRNQTLPMCESAGACELADFRATSLPTLVQMVASGVGITLLPEIALDVEIRPDSPIVVRTFSGEAPYRTLGLAWRPASPFGEQFGQLAATLAGPDAVLH